MVDARLVEYVSDLLKKGYSAQTIHDQLVSHGYDEHTTAAALARATSPFPFNPLLLLASLGGLALIGIVILTITTLSTPDPHITLTLSPDATTIPQSGTLTFRATMKNSITDPTEVTIRHDILTNGKLAQRETDAIIIRADHSQTIRIPLEPSLAPGTHTLQTTITFDGTEKTQQFSFTVEQGTTPATAPAATLAACTPSCDDFDACTLDTCTNGLCAYSPKSACCGDNVCDAGESVLSCSQDCRNNDAPSAADITNDAIALVTRDKQLAAQECAKIAPDFEHDNCFSQLSQTAQDPLFCTPLFNPERKDACYLQFALTNPAVCTSIIDERLQQTCLQYARFAAINA